MRARTISAPRAGTFARAGRIRRHDPKGFFSHLQKKSCLTKGSDGGSLADAWRRCAHMEMVRPECGRRPIEKARGRFPGAGS